MGTLLRARPDLDAAGTAPGLPFAALRALHDRARALVLEDELGAPRPGLADTLREQLAELERLLGAVEAFLGEEAPLAQLCFVGVLELADARRGLGLSLGPDDAMGALDSARRKLCRVARAVLENARRLGFTVPTPELPEGDLQEALATRRLYARFRRAIREPADESGEAIIAAARYAAGALAHLVTAPEYQAVRASDRAIIRRLHERVVAWARGARVAREGLHILSDVQACAGLLRGINRREVLRAHDAERLAELAGGPAGGHAAFLEGLATLEGLDDELDRMLEELREGVPEVLLPALVPVLGRLRESARPAPTQGGEPAFLDETGPWE